MSAAKSLFKSPAVRTPTMKELGDIAKRLGYEMSDSDLAQYQDFMGKAMGNYNKLSKYPEPLPVVKYPRMPGKTLPPSENPNNAWFVKTDITGAESGKLKGKTIAIKDNMAVAGVQWAVGSKLLDGYIPEYDATVVTRVLDEGGYIAGKASVEDFCVSGSSFTNSFGPVLNYHDPTRSAGGSSSGCAVLVAAGEVDMAIGGDTGGSIRLPACWNGVVGLKPTFGLVPVTGSMLIEPTQDHLGPITKTVQDCALMLEVIAGYDELDGRQHPGIQVKEYSKMISSDLKGVKIGILTEGFDETESDVEALVREAALKLKTVGAVVEEVSVSMHNDASAIWGPVVIEGAYEAMISCGGSPMGLKGFQPTSLVDAVSRGMQARPNHLPPTVKYAGLIGAFMKEHYNNHFYMKSSNLMRTLRQAYDAALDNYDVLVMPTIRFKPPKLPGADASVMEQLIQSMSNLANTCPFNATGHPAMTVNAGFIQGLPVGMQMIAKHWQEPTLFNVGQAVEKITSGN